MNEDNPVQMPQDEVLRIVQTIKQNHLPFWLDGGWGVDALLGEQTRTHKDLDLCIYLSDAEKVKKTLEQIGYTDITDESPTRLILRDTNDHRVDLHLLVFEENGDGKQNYNGGFNLYPANGLNSEGQIGRMSVACLSPQLQISFRTTYKPNEKSKHDIQVLSDKFNIPKPQGF